MRYMAIIWILEPPGVSCIFIPCMELSKFAFQVFPTKQGAYKDYSYAQIRLSPSLCAKV